MGTDQLHNSSLIKIESINNLIRPSVNYWHQTISLIKPEIDRSTKKNWYEMKHTITISLTEISSAINIKLNNWRKNLMIPGKTIEADKRWDDCKQILSEIFGMEVIMSYYYSSLWFLFGWLYSFVILKQKPPLMVACPQRIYDVIRCAPKYNKK